MSDANNVLVSLNTGKVMVSKEEWPVVASSRFDWHDGKVEFQANRKQSARLYVRVNKKHGERLVYAICEVESNWQSESNRTVKRGVRAPSTRPIHELVRMIASQIVESEIGIPNLAIEDLASDCIDELPAEVL